MSDKENGEAPAPKPQASPQRPPLAISTNEEQGGSQNTTIGISIRKKK